ncbi:DUF3450 domain-containing protein [Colwellia sp. D2M02]|uniref:DUF3450 domain-containing protein n=1 Tax=Colwellia sp. D2M02 TaxID=2841562 RepID=UPI001C07FC35|nr:DUF3450 domain-containing protein [Colwellia sp. D2M02]MBU2894734.1 DUF3450 domain-containing protein [Colwellia sp. D2M02]
MKLSPLATASLVVSLQASSLLFTGALLAQTTNAQADSQLNKVVEAGENITQSAAKSQQKVNKLTEKVQTKLQQFKTVTKEVDGLTVYNQQMQNQLDNQMAELAQLAQSMEEVSVIERQISPLMARMITTLEDFIALDVPFLPVERAKRVNDLKAMMNRADIAVSEKFRRVLEAYQIEVDYGRTIEAYSGTLALNGQNTDVDFLRVGRVSLVYQTRDGSQLGQWQQTNGKGDWQALSQDYRLGVNKALRIARKQLAPDLMMIPLTTNISNGTLTAAAE